MEKYLVDTNVIIDYLRDEPKAVSFLDRLEKVIISTVVAGEIYQGAKNKRALKIIKDFFLKHCQILPINEQTSILALELLERHTLPSGLLILDALIAATAIKFDLTLVTRNIRHFKMIEGLKIENWELT